MFNNQIIAGSSGQGGGFYSYSIDQSLRFNNDDNAYLEFTPSSAGNRDTWTISMWVKRSGLGLAQSKLFAAGSSLASNHNNSFYMWFQSDDTLRIQNESSGAAYTRMDTTRVFRDVSSFYHIVYVYDSSQSTSSDRQQLYINGVRETVFDDTLYPSLNQDSQVNATHVHRIGASTIGNTFDGYMAEVNFIDGTALDATSFGETSNGVWVPKAYSGSYGTNGFYLSFANSAAIGDDLSGNTNDWTANNLAASDVVPDSPTNNMAVLSTVGKYTNATSDDVREGGLEERGNSSGYAGTVTFDATDTDGYYYEITHTGTPGTGCTHGMMNFTDSINQYGGVPGDSDRSGFWGVYRRGAGGSNQFWYYLDGVETATLGVAGAANDVWMYLIKDGKFYIGINGTWFNSADPSAGTGHYASGLTGTDWTIFSGNGNNVTGGHKIRVDRNLWDYGDASYKEIKTSNIAEPAIGPNSDTTSDEHFDTALWTADVTNPAAGDKSISLSFQPDLVWSKNRDNAENHYWMDSVRGDNDGSKWLRSNSNAAEGADAVGSTTAKYDFTSTGFDIIDTDSTSGEVYYSPTSRTYVGWCWKGGGTAASNTDGSITSSVSANQDAGFSIVSYTGTGANATVGHGLSSAPEMVIVKNRTTASRDWAVGHDGLGSWGNYIQLNLTNALTSAGAIWNSTAPTSSVFSIGTNVQMNTSGNNHIAYCFHSVEGFSKVGKYLGNGNANGPFVYTGFRPAWVMWKNASAAGTVWVIFDAVRETYNFLDAQLRPNETTAENSAGASYSMDFLSNGFKLKSSDSNFNGSGNTIIYLAFAESPFKYANAR